MIGPLKPGPKPSASRSYARRGDWSSLRLPVSPKPEPQRRAPGPRATSSTTRPARERGPRAVLDDAAPPVPELLLARLRRAVRDLVARAAAGTSCSRRSRRRAPTMPSSANVAMAEQDREQEADRDDEHADAPRYVVTSIRRPGEADQRREQRDRRDHHRRARRARRRWRGRARTAGPSGRGPSSEMITVAPANSTARPDVSTADGGRVLGFEPGVQASRGNA